MLREQELPGLGLLAEVLQALAVGGGSRFDHGLRGGLLGLLERELDDRVQRLAMLYVPGEIPCGIAHRLAGAPESEQPT